MQHMLSLKQTGSCYGLFGHKDVYFHESSMLGGFFTVVQSLSHVQLFVTHGLQHARLPFPSPGACSDSCPLSRWCHLIVSSSVALFSSCPQSVPASRSFPMSWLFTSGGQSIRASASASVLPVNIQGWFPLGLTCLCWLSTNIICARLSVTLWTAALQAPLSMGFFKQEYWSGLPFPSSGNKRCYNIIMLFKQ